MFVDLAPKKRTIDITRLGNWSKIQSRDQCPQPLLSSRRMVDPTIEVDKAIHPLLGRKEGHRSKMVRHSTYFLSQEHSNGRDSRLDIDSISLQLLDAFR
jgi:hypothetical protein